MKKMYNIIVLLCTFLSSYPITITNKNERVGRLGDQLIYYVKLKLLCRQNGYRFILTPFNGSDLFLFSLIEESISGLNIKARVIFQKNTDISFFEDDAVVYAPSFFLNPQYPNTLQDLDDFRQFRIEMKTLISPIQLISIPKMDGVITVAIHIRKGSGKDLPLLSRQLYDSETPIIIAEDTRFSVIKEPALTINAMHKHKFLPFHDVYCPCRFPPDQYYIDQIKYLKKLLGNMPLRCHIFTDYANPKLLVRKYEQAISDPEITFVCREKYTGAITDVVEDLWMMMHSHCLIRSSSHFSLMAEFLGNHAIVISPRNYRWELNNKKLVITEVTVSKPSDYAYDL